MPTRVESPSGQAPTTSATASTWPVTIWPPSSSPRRSARSRLSLRALAPAIGGGLRDRLARDVDGEPVLALVDDGQAHAGAGDGGAEVDPVEIVARADDQPQVAALLGAAHGADVGDDPGEHWPRLAAALALVNFEPVGPEPLLIDQPPAAMRIGDRVEADIAEARLALADDDRRAVDRACGRPDPRLRKAVAVADPPSTSKSLTS